MPIPYLASVRPEGARRQNGHERAEVLMMRPAAFSPYQPCKQCRHIRCSHPARPHARFRSDLGKSEKQSEQVPNSLRRRETQDWSSLITSGELRTNLPCSLRCLGAVSGRRETEAQKFSIPAVEMVWKSDRLLNGSGSLLFWLISSHSVPFSLESLLAVVSTFTVVVLPPIQA
jgi:hypothetical protein